jgi:hypothetical protein
MRRALAPSLLALLLFGCGPLGKREYIGRADHICGQMQTNEAQGHNVIARDQRLRERLGRLRAPNELKDRVRTYLVALDKRLERQRRAGHALAKLPAEQRSAVRVGLQVCGRG